MTEHDEALRLAADVVEEGVNYTADAIPLATALLAYHAECERLRKGLEEMRRDVTGNMWRCSMDAQRAADIAADVDALIGKAGE